MSKTLMRSWRRRLLRIHTALYLLDHADPERVIGHRTKSASPKPFSLDVEEASALRNITHYLVTHELDLLLELLDRTKPQVIVNYAAQGEARCHGNIRGGSFETNSMALARLAEVLMKRRLARALHSDRHVEMYGSVERPSTEDDPIKRRAPTRASKWRSTSIFCRCTSS